MYTWTDRETICEGKKSPGIRSSEWDEGERGGEEVEEIERGPKGRMRGKNIERRQRTLV